MNRIYFDYASTTPTDPLVIKAMEPFFFEAFGNASSPHSIGQEALKALEDSRKTVADFWGAKPAEIVFTSGATESNNHAISGIVYHAMERGDHIIVSSVEHHSVLEPVEQLKRDGFKVTYLPVTSDGLVNPEDVKKAVNDQTILIAVMHASNEIGTIQPIKEISAIARERDVPFLVDAVQAAGHIPLNVKDLGCDLLSVSAHKFYGPKGVGALYIREGVKVSPFLLGGDQERGRRASTQNVAACVGMAKAVEICRQHMQEEARRQSAWRDRIIKEISQKVKGVQVNGSLANRLPNNAHFSFEGISGEALLMSLDMKGICVSMGSACTSGALEPSHVLRAIGLSDDWAMGALRVSLGRFNREEDIIQLLEILPQTVEELRV